MAAFYLSVGYEDNESDKIEGIIDQPPRVMYPF